MNDRVISQLKCAENLSLLLQDLSTLQNKQMFFLGGFIKSGTTWVERLLDAHPEIACKGEAHFGSLLEPALRSGISGYNQIIPDKGNWERLNDEEVHSAETTEYCYTEQEFDDILSLVIRLLMSKWCSKDNLRAVGEKTPNNARYFQRLLQLFPEARHIYIIRDVRDIIVSGWFFNLALDAESTRGKFESIHHYAVYIAQTWVQEIADSLKLIKQVEDRILSIKYENLWHEPQFYTEKLLKFLDVDHSSETVRLCLQKTEFSRLSGGRDRGAENRTSFYRKGIIGDWKNHLEHDTLIEIEMYCGAMLDHLEYPQYQS